jgi:lipopolysaccharide transport system permease protein
MTLAAEETIALEEAGPGIEGPSPAPIALREHPVVSIRPPGRWAALGLGEVWGYRELLYFLMWRDVKVRYKQTVLGVTWALIQPLLTMLIFTLFFGKLAGVPSDNIPYPIFAYAGLLPWTFFATAVTSSGNSLVGSSNLISKVYFPRLVIPAAAVGAALVDFGIGFILLERPDAAYPGHTHNGGCAGCGDAACCS